MKNIQLLRHLIREVCRHLITETIDVDAAWDVLERWESSLRQNKGIVVARIKSMKKGTNGVAFEWQDKVVKVTDDRAEAYACNALIGSGVEALVKIFDVWQFGETGQVGEKGVYAVVQERLTDLSEEESKRFNNALVLTRWPIFLNKNGYDWDATEAATDAYAASKAKSEEEAAKFRTAWQTLLEFGVKEMHDGLISVGIKFHDYHAGNLMKRDGKIVLIDPGLSRLAGGEDPAVLQEAARKRHRRH
jgi:hypothetical protein